MLCDLRTWSRLTRPRMTRNTHVVYRMMIGRNTMARHIMRNKVPWLDDASHTVRLERGSTEDGIRNGNRAKPAAAMVPATERQLLKKPRKPWRATNSCTPSAPTNATTGAIQKAGWAMYPANHDAPTATCFAMGFETPSVTTGPATA